jgi:hypothetical protein
MSETVDLTDALCKIECVVEWGLSMDTNFLKAHAERCRSLAENADDLLSDDC